MHFHGSVTDTRDTSSSETVLVKEKRDQDTERDLRASGDEKQHVKKIKLDISVVRTALGITAAERRTGSKEGGK